MRAIPIVMKWLEAPQDTVAERCFQPFKKRMPRKNALASSKLPCTEEEFHVIIYCWTIGGLLQPFKSTLSEAKHKNPNLYHVHQSFSHLALHYIM